MCRAPRIARLTLVADDDPCLASRWRCVDLLHLEPLGFVSSRDALSATTLEKSSVASRYGSGPISDSLAEGGGA